MVRKIVVKPLSIANQAVGLRVKYPGSEVVKFGNYLRWKGTLTPTPISPSYEVQVVYSIGKPPQIAILSPILKRDNTNKLPHVYSHDEQRLCLYYPPDKSWTADKHIADLIIPWVSDWLYYYETWLFTKKWEGGGTHNADHDFV